MAGFAIDLGGPGRLASLNGIVGGIGKGRSCQTTTIVLPDSTFVQVVNANPLRSWLFINNPGAGNINIYFGNQADATGIVLASLGTIQIDANLPWTGQVQAIQYSGGPVNISITEASIIL